MARKPMENRFALPTIATALLANLLLAGCSDGAGTVGSPADISGAPATNGVFDAALTQDGIGGLWMSYSAVNASLNDTVLPRVGTRLASSSNAGSSWVDAGVAPNTPQEIQVSDGAGGTTWAVWQYEVSRLLYDPHASDSNLRWKLFWHRYLQANINGRAERLFQHGWFGVTTSAAPTGTWSSERKLFVGTGYDVSNNSVIGAPEYVPASLASGGQLGGCVVFSEPGALATASGIYISLKCATVGNTGKVVLLRCANNLTAASCVYRGDLLLDSEAQRFAPSGQNYDGFSATELVMIGTTPYLIVTPTLADFYHGCLVFQIADLNNATLVRDVSNNPVLQTTITGTSGSFNGACGYTPAASSSGVIYSEVQGSAPQFRLYQSGITLP